MLIQDQQVQELVNQASVLLESERKKGFPELMQKGSKWFQDDIYVFVLNMNGKMLMHPTMPALVGKKQGDLKDANGKLVVQEIIRTAKSPEGSGWVEYMWPKPNVTEPVKKRVYVNTLELQGKKKKFKWIIASGYYIDE